MIYLDNNATTALAPEVYEAMAPYWTGPPGNPSSRHAAGRHARRGVDRARRQLATALGCEENEIVFTASATEANNLAIFGLAGAPEDRVLISPAEHPSCLEPVAALARRGWIVESLGLDASGVVASNIELPASKLAVLQLANGETGCIQDVEAFSHRLASECRLHCDAVQAVGKIPVDFRRLGVATMSLSGHKLHGPAGIAALLVRGDVQLRPMLFGGHQQRGIRPGTEAVALIVGLGAAIELVVGQLKQSSARMGELRDRFEERIMDGVPDVVLNGPAGRNRLPNCCNLSFLGVAVEPLLIALDLAGVCCSAGTACASGSLESSYVLKAMGIAEERLQSALRFSVGRFTTAAEVDEAATIVCRTVATLRARGKMLK